MMTYLLDYEFNQQEIAEFRAMNKMFLVDKLEEYQEITKKNIEALRNFGVSNYKEVFKRHAEIFLMDNEAFIKMLGKYDKEDLIDKFKINPDVIEIL